MKESSFLQDKAATVERLQKIPFLRQMQPDFLNGILSVSRIRKYDAGETIIEQGRKDKWFYLLLSGRVSITQGDAEIADLDKPGELFGETALLDTGLKSNGATAIRETICLAMDAGNSQKIEAGEQAVGYAMLYRFLCEVLARRLDKTNEDLRLTQHELDMVKASHWNS